MMFRGPAYSYLGLLLLAVAAFWPLYLSRLGTNGWIRLRQLGVVTSIAALISAVIVSLFVHGEAQFVARRLYTGG
jgi:hypothetical protein